MNIFKKLIEKFSNKKTIDVSTESDTQPNDIKLINMNISASSVQPLEEARQNAVATANGSLKDIGEVGKLNYSAKFLDFVDRFNSYLNKNEAHNAMLDYAFKGEENAKKHYNRIAEKIRRGVKFQLPDNGIVLDIKFNNNFIESYSPYIPVIKLPFDVVVLEFNSPDTWSPSGTPKNVPCILICEQFDDRIEFESVSCIDSNPTIRKNFWYLATHKSSILEGQWDSLALQVDGVNTRGANKVWDDYMKLSELESLHVILRFLSALCCSNTEIVDAEAPDQKLNASRMRKGKTPFFTYKMLTIKAQSRKGEGEDRTHNSPRVHIRRGHIRKLKDKTVWVNSCVVGDKKKGIVSKIYNLKKAG